MDLEFKDNSYSIKNIDYEMIQIVLNGMTCERKKIADKLAYAKTCLFKDYSENQKDDFRVQIEYLKLKIEEIKDIVNKFNIELENIPLK
jgi:hypothetical protein